LLSQTFFCGTRRHPKTLPGTTRKGAESERESPDAWFFLAERIVVPEVDLDEQPRADGGLLSGTFIAEDRRGMAFIGFGSGCLKPFEI
jgi:hypothetical protein